MRRVNVKVEKEKKNSLSSLDASSTSDHKVLGETQVSSHFGGPALLFGGYLFFYSWVHLYYYFQAFGVSLTLLDVSIYFYFAFAWTVVREFGAVICIVLFLGAAIYVALNSAWRCDDNPLINYIHKVGFAWFLLIGLYGTFALAQHQGTFQAQQARDGAILKTIHIKFESDVAKRFPVILSGDLKGVSLDPGESMDAKLLIETKGGYFVLLQRVGNTGAYIGYGAVFSIPKKHVAYVEISMPDSVRITSIAHKIKINWFGEFFD